MAARLEEWGGFLILMLEIPESPAIPADPQVLGISGISGDFYFFCHKKWFRCPGQKHY
jgi:hypothetical protein